jgi:hypothetical protein
LALRTEHQGWLREGDPKVHRSFAPGLPTRKSDILETEAMNMYYR